LANGGTQSWWAMIVSAPQQQLVKHRLSANHYQSSPQLRQCDWVHQLDGPDEAEREGCGV
jgi:hypothetical protein